MMGFDPYPQKDVATGVLFANKPNVKNLSPSLKVLKESVIRLSVDMPFNTFDVTMKHWCNQGILMINSALTCEMNNTSSHTMIWRPMPNDVFTQINTLLIEKYGQPIQWLIEN